MTELDRSDFKSLYCARFGCPPEQFEPHLWRAALHRRSLPLSLLLSRLSPRFFSRDLALLKQLAVVKTQQEFKTEIDDFRRTMARKGNWVQRLLRVRVSGQRLMQFGALLPK